MYGPSEKSVRLFSLQCIVQKKFVPEVRIPISQRRGNSFRFLAIFCTEMNNLHFSSLRSCPTSSCVCWRKAARACARHGTTLDDQQVRTRWPAGHSEYCSYTETFLRHVDQEEVLILYLRPLYDCPPSQQRASRAGRRLEIMFPRGNDSDNEKGTVVIGLSESASSISELVCRQGTVPVCDVVRQLST